MCYVTYHATEDKGLQKLENVCIPYTTIGKEQLDVESPLSSVTLPPPTSHDRSCTQPNEPSTFHNCRSEPRSVQMLPMCSLSIGSVEFQRNPRINAARDAVGCTLFVDLRCEGQKKGKSVDGSQGGKKGCRRQLKRERRKEEKKRKERVQNRWWRRGSCTYHVVEVVGAFEST